MLLHFSYNNCTYKMDRMAEATLVAKDKIYIFLFCNTTSLVYSDLFAAHLLLL